METKNNGIGCFQIVLFGVFILGTLLMFSKTADLMAAFAPSSIGGYTGLEVVYGVAVALLVDGLVAAMKLKILFMGKAQSAIAWGWDIILTLFPFVISSFAQVFDSFLVRDTLQSQPETIQFLAAWGIPLVPALIVLGILIYGFIESAPDGLFQGVQGGPGGGLGFKLPKISMPKFPRKTESPSPTSASIEKK